MSAKYACITRHRTAFPIGLMCRLLGVSASGFYAAQGRRPSAHAVRDEQLLLAMRTAHRQSRQRYGAPRVRADLVAQGDRVSPKRVARLMRADGLRGRRRRRVVHTTDSGHAAPVAPNTLARQFAVAATPVCDRVWVGDITEILDAYVFASVTEVRELTSDWLDRYNTQRPHDSLGHVPPLTYRPRPTALPESVSKL